ncbi:hypothetical protein, partial [Escherichia coli]|uniref:hypothetical protein n=1 Tax=Escherichia coli TaxID=562 RepID=UPI000DD9247A
TADRNRSHWSTSKTPSYTKSVSWQHHPRNQLPMIDHKIFILQQVIMGFLDSLRPLQFIFAVILPHFVVNKKRLRNAILL